MKNPTGKQKRGQLFRPPPANVHNAMVEAGTNYAQRKQLGESIQPTWRQRPGDTATVKNSSGADLDDAGRVLQISDKLVTTLDPDHLWLVGITPVVPSTNQVGISLRPIPDESIDEIKISGHAYAWVTVNDAQHRFADVVNGSDTLGSCWHGYPIVYKPSGIGEKACVVDLSRYRDGPWKGVISEVDGIDAGDTGEVTVWWQGAETTTPDTVQAKFAWMAGTGNAAEGAECLFWWVRDEGIYEIFELEC